MVVVVVDQTIPRMEPNRNTIRKKCVIRAIVVRLNASTAIRNRVWQFGALCNAAAGRRIMIAPYYKVYLVSFRFVSVVDDVVGVVTFWIFGYLFWLPLLTNYREENCRRRRRRFVGAGSL